MDPKVAKAIAELQHALGHVLDCERNCADCRQLAGGAIRDNAKIINQAMQVWLELDDDA